LKLLALMLVFIIISPNLLFAAEAETEFISTDLEKLSVYLKLDPIASKKLTEMISKNNNGQNIHLISITDPKMLDELNDLVKDRDIYRNRGHDPTTLLRDLDQRFESANEVKVQFLPVVAYYFLAGAFGFMAGSVLANGSEPDNKTVHITYIIENPTGPFSISNTGIDTKEIQNISYAPSYALSVSNNSINSMEKPPSSYNLSESNTTSKLSAHVFSPSI